MSGTSIIAKFSMSLTLKAPRKNVSKMSSAEVVCPKLPSITDELSIEANSVDPEQTAPICSNRSSLIWVHTVCHRGFLNISAD